MSISVSCDCGREYSLPDSAAGRRFKCKDCGEPVAVKVRKKRRRPRDEDEFEDEFDDDFDTEEEWDEPRPGKRRRKSSGGGSKSKRGRREELPAGIALTGNIARWIGLVGGAIGLACGLVLVLAGLLHPMILLICFVCGGGMLGGAIVASQGLSADSKLPVGRRKSLVNTGSGMVFGALGAGVVMFMTHMAGRKN